MPDPKFPTEGDPAVRTAAAKSMWPRVRKWLEESGDDHAEEAEDEFLKIMARNFVSDGYELAKDCEDLGWSPDADLVEILDHFGMDLHHACKAAREEWVRTTNWTPAFKIGDKVEFKLRLQWVAGVITDVKATEGTYTINQNLSALPKVGGYIIANGDVRNAP